MKKLKSSFVQKAFICTFFTLLICCLAYLTLDFSLFDRRQLPEFSFSKFLKGEYQDRVDEYFSAITPLSRSATYLKTHCDMLIGKSFINGICINKSSLIKIPKFPTTQDLKHISEKINEFCDKTEQSIYSLIIPTKLQINNEQFLAFTFKGDDLRVINEYNENLNDAIVRLDALTPLMYIKDMATFYNTDCRMTGWGAFLVYSHNIKQLGAVACDISQFNIEHIVGNFYGKLFHKTPYANVSPDVIDVFRYNGYPVSGSVSQVFNDQSFSNRLTIEDLSQEHEADPVNVVLGETSPIKNISTNSKNKAKILIFADENIDSLVHFLAIHYSDITIVDLAEVKKVDYKLKNSIKQVNCSAYDQILFAYGIESLIDVEQFDALDMFNLRPIAKK